MLNILKRLHRDDEGQDMIEYALLGSLIAIVVALALPALTDAITGAFETIATQLGGGA